MIDTIEQEITRLKATLTPAEAAEVDYEAPMEEAEEAAPEQPAQPARKTCPQCGAPIEKDFVVCPVCDTQVRNVCPSCHRPLDAHWKVCPYCRTRIQ